MLVVRGVSGDFLSLHMKDSPFVKEMQRRYGVDALDERLQPQQYKLSHVPVSLSRHAGIRHVSRPLPKTAKRCGQG